MIDTETRTTWDVRFRCEDGEWPDMIAYNGAAFRPQAVSIRVIRQPASIDPACAPEIYHIDVSGPRVLKGGRLSQATWLERGWAWRPARELPEGERAPDWLIELCERALAQVTGQEDGKVTLTVVVTAPEDPETVAAAVSYALDNPGNYPDDVNTMEWGVSVYDQGREPDQSPHFCAICGGPPHSEDNPGPC